jgi:ankyrin repeat protein
MKNTARLLILFFVFFYAIPLPAEKIHEAVQKGNLEKVKALVAQNEAVVHSQDDTGRTPLHWACRGRSLELVVFLVGKGADVNALDNNQIAPLHSLAARNNVQAAKVLIGKGADINIKDYDKQTPLHHAAASGHTEISNLLVKKGAKLEIKDNWGRTPLLLCARERGGPELARVLIEGGAEVNARDKFGATSLNLASWRGKEGVVDVLLASGADVATKGSESRRLMMHAASHGLENLFSRLDSGGADLTLTLQSGGTLLHEAAGGGSLPIIKDLIAKGLNVKQKDQFGWTPLHYAAKNGRDPAVGFLIENGADLDARSIMGQSSFNVAQEFKQTAVIEVLKSKKADQSPLVFPLLQGDYLGQKAPGETPEVFGLGIVSSIWGLHSSVVFAPDGNTALWTPMVWMPGSLYSTGIIYMMERENNHWSPPQTAFFSGKFDDDVPFFSPDGNKLFFISSRPLPDVPQSRKERIWYMDKTGEGWTDPQPVDAAVNDMQLHWQFSVNNEGDLYFNSRAADGFGGGDIYWSKFKEGRYLKPKNCGPAINTEKGEGTPFISPDGSYLIFQRELDLFISFRKADGGWNEAKTLGSPINTRGNELCPVVSPDGKFLFFISTRGGDNQVFWVDAGIIQRMK